jgi:hydroxypyruvate reductase
VRAALSAADPAVCVARGLPDLSRGVATARRWNLIAAGKAAVPMAGACLASLPARPARAMVAAPGVRHGEAGDVEYFAAGHPVPTEASLAAGRCALEIAGGTSADDVLVVLLSGGASALLEAPADGVTLADLQATTTRLLRAGADIMALNAVRKHLSCVKGGRLAAAAAGPVITLAISDVVGDDPAVIASGPTVADPSTYADALAVLARFGGVDAYPRAVVDALTQGRDGARPESPKAGSAALARTLTRIVGAGRDAIDGARREAGARGYDVDVLAAPVIGEARAAALDLVARIRAGAAARSGRLCLLSAGETTVTVVGGGTGGRNQELALALASPLSILHREVVVASVGTDGIDGPTSAAGALVDSTTCARARAAGLGDAEPYLMDNNAHAYFHGIGDLVVTGPTGTNVGDIQVALLGDGAPAPAGSP